MARLIIALIMRVGGGDLTVEHVVGKFSHAKIYTDSSTHPNNPYGSRSKSTLGLSTLQCSVSPTPKAAKRWSTSNIYCSIQQPCRGEPCNRYQGSGLLRGRRGTCLHLAYLGRLQRRVLCLHHKASITTDPERQSPSPTVFPA